MYDDQLGREVDYFDLCPKTPMIFFNHYWDDVPSMPRWPNDKPIYLMPNIEMIELTPEYYWRVNAVLCKTQICFDRVMKWYEQEGNPRNAEVFYTKHTSSDQAQFARKRLGEDAIAPKDFTNRSNFTKLTAEAAFLMCPSRTEGYGHYINQGRASGAVIVTTDAAPMNELITSRKMGVLVQAMHQMDDRMLLGGKYKGEHGLKNVNGLIAAFSSFHLCQTVKTMVQSTTSEQRAAMGANARKQYHEDTNFFAEAMQELREFARKGGR
ncbi:unnamed protein product [Phytophthora lilii]|uniref:Unnamed protein product n=1 Tax=Phytophthora lilii TaxID=2077276 RepID=A0A9W6WX04_9STRA|nr:unnamed protein product [Phytophthora lilii]